MLYARLAIIVCFLIFIIGGIGVQKTSNYENTWGYMLIYGIVATILVSVGTLIAYVIQIS